jgi:hypothetical protein
MQKEDTTGRKSRLKQEFYDIARTLNRTLSYYPGLSTPNEYTVTTEKERKTIMRFITTLANGAGVSHANLTYAQTYIEAIKRVGGIDSGNRLAMKLRDRATLIEYRLKDAKQAAKRTAPGSLPSNPRADYTVKVFSTTDDADAPARWQVTIRPGEVSNGTLAAIQRADGSLILRRVYYERGRTVVKCKSLTRGGKVTRYAMSDVTILGEVVNCEDAPLPKPKKKGNNSRLIAEIRRRLDRLNEEDDQIIRCSERYKLEKQLYDLEHPENWNDWSKWEEDEEAA